MHQQQRDRRGGHARDALRLAQGLRLHALQLRILAQAAALVKPGGRLAVVTFHSLEDRIVKRFFQIASGTESNANRYAPAKADTTAQAREEAG